MFLSCCLTETTRHHELQPSALAERGWIARDGNGVSGACDARRKCRYQATVPTVAATALRAVIVPSSAPRVLWSPRRNTVRPMFRGKCRSKTRLVRKRNTIRPSAKHPRSRQGPVRQGVGDPGCTPWARRPKSRPCGSAPPKTALACTSGPFGEVAPGDSPCRKAEQPTRGRDGVRRVDPPARTVPVRPDHPVAAAEAESGSSWTAWS